MADGVDTVARYRAFARIEAAGSSPSYERLSLAVAADADLIERLDALPPPKRQPNLLLAACRYLGAPVGDPGEFLDFVRSRWSDIAAVVSERSTQTNEPARTAAFLPLLGRIEGPVALIEVGASAGLCLHPDRYRIRYDADPPAGPTESPVVIDVVTDIDALAPLAVTG